MTAPAPVEPPRFAGVTGGCGTSVLAAALAGVDGGVYRGRGRVDVLVCRPTMSSLAAAQAALTLLGRPPVLAVVADLPRAVTSRAKARLRLTEPHLAEVVHVPFVPELRQVDDVRETAAAWCSPDPPRWLRDFGEAMTDLRDAVLPLLESYAAAARYAVPAAPSPRPHIPPLPLVQPGMAPLGRRR